MEGHDENCERFWRNVIADLLDRETERDFADSGDTQKWFKEGIRYAIMMIRWDVLDL